MTDMTYAKSAGTRLPAAGADAHLAVAVSSLLCTVALEPVAVSGALTAPRIRVQGTGLPFAGSAAWGPPG